MELNRKAEMYIRCVLIVKPPQNWELSCVCCISNSIICVL